MTNGLKLKPIGKCLENRKFFTTKNFFGQHPLHTITFDFTWLLI